MPMQQSQQVPQQATSIQQSQTVPHVASTQQILEQPQKISQQAAAIHQPPQVPQQILQQVTPIQQPQQSPQQVPQQVAPIQQPQQGSQQAVSIQQPQHIPQQAPQQVAPLQQPQVSQQAASTQQLQHIPQQVPQQVTSMQHPQHISQQVTSMQHPQHIPQQVASIQQPHHIPQQVTYNSNSLFHNSTQAQQVPQQATTMQQSQQMATIQAQQVSSIQQPQQVPQQMISIQQPQQGHPQVPQQVASMTQSQHAPQQVPQQGTSMQMAPGLQSKQVASQQIASLQIPQQVASMQQVTQHGASSQQPQLVPQQVACGQPTSQSQHTVPLHQVSAVPQQVTLMQQVSQCQEISLDTLGPQQEQQMTQIHHSTNQHPCVMQHMLFHVPPQQQKEEQFVLPSNSKDQLPAVSQQDMEKHQQSEFSDLIVQEQMPFKNSMAASLDQQTAFTAVNESNQSIIKDQTFHRWGKLQDIYQMFASMTVSISVSDEHEHQPAVQKQESIQGLVQDLPKEGVTGCDLPCGNGKQDKSKQRRASCARPEKGTKFQLTVLQVEDNFVLENEKDKFVDELRAIVCQAQDIISSLPIEERAAGMESADPNNCQTGSSEQVQINPASTQSGSDAAPQSSPVGRWRFCINQTIKNRETQASCTPVQSMKTVQGCQTTDCIKESTKEERPEYCSQPVDNLSNQHKPSPSFSSEDLTNDSVVSEPQILEPEHSAVSHEAEGSTDKLPSASTSDNTDVTTYDSEAWLDPLPAETQSNGAPLSSYVSHPASVVNELNLSTETFESTPMITEEAEHVINAEQTAASVQTPSQEGVSSTSILESDSEGPPKMDFVDNNIKTLDEKLRTLLYQEHSLSGTSPESQKDTQSAVESPFSSSAEDTFPCPGHETQDTNSPQETDPQAALIPSGSHPDSLPVMTQEARVITSVPRDFCRHEVSLEASFPENPVACPASESSGGAVNLHAGGGYFGLSFTCPSLKNPISKKSWTRKLKSWAYRLRQTSFFKKSKVRQEEMTADVASDWISLSEQATRDNKISGHSKSGAGSFQRGRFQ
ncbi:hypothetical protein E2320_022914, partial [Naja naja]